MTELRRYKNSKRALAEINDYIDRYPHLTLSQVLINLGVTCEWSAEGDGYEYKFEIVDWTEDPSDQLNRININKHNPLV